MLTHPIQNSSVGNAIGLRDSIYGALGGIYIIIYVNYKVEYGKIRKGTELWQLWPYSSEFMGRSSFSSVENRF
jgi:hypothetical protein